MITVVLKECGFFEFFNVSSISNQSFADASSSNITTYAYRLSGTFKRKK